MTQDSTEGPEKSPTRDELLKQKAKCTWWLMSKRGLSGGKGLTTGTPALYQAVLKLASSWPIESALACSSKPGLDTLTPEPLQAMVHGLLKRLLRAMVRASVWPLVSHLYAQLSKMSSKLKTLPGFPHHCARGPSIFSLKQPAPCGRQQRLA